jgi:hypothetical protein
MEWCGGDGISIWFHEGWTVWVVSVLEVEFWSGLMDVLVKLKSGLGVLN